MQQQSRSDNQSDNTQAGSRADNAQGQQSQVTAQKQQSQRQDTSLDEDQDLGPSADNNWNDSKNR